MCAFKPLWINVPVLCLLCVACWGSPVRLQQENEVLQGSQDGGPAGRKMCIPTAYGCVDLSDPQIRPRDNEEVTKVGNSFPNENGGLGPIYRPPCIPTAWGCIDPSDPGFRPK